jgi:hypothetical protein
MFIITQVPHATHTEVYLRLLLIIYACVNDQSGWTRWVGHVARVGRREKHTGFGCVNHVEDPVYQRKISVYPVGVLHPPLSRANCPN